MNANVDLTQSLAQMRERRGTAPEAKIDNSVRKISTQLYLISGAALSLLGYFALATLVTDTSDRIIGAVIIYAWIFSLTLGFTGLLLDILRLFMQLAMTLSNEMAIRIQEREYDLANVAELLRFNEKELSCELKSIDIQIERMQRRTALLAGGSDKLSLLAITALGWAVWTQFPLGSAIWSEKIFTYGMTFLIGITLGGVLVNLILNKYRYQKNILQLALEYKNQNITLHRYYVYPTPPIKVHINNAYKKLLAIMPFN